MNDLKRWAAVAVFFVSAFASATSSAAQSPFDGTWRTVPSQSRFSSKPIVVFLSEGWYHCTSCNPQIDVKADGSDQPVIDRAYDTISVREIDHKTIDIVTKKGGVILSQQTRTVSNGGNTLTVISIERSFKGGPVDKEETTSTRVEIAPAAINATSGSWRILRVKHSDNVLLTTYKSNGDELTVSHSAGKTYTARFDGKDYPVNGALHCNAVSLKRMDKSTIEELEKRDGAVVSVIRATVSADGRKMTVVRTNLLTDRTTTYVAFKQ